MKDTQIDIGFILTEPVTVLTNITIGLTCFYFCLTLSKQKQIPEWTIYWYRFFLWIGVSAIVGGVFHGLKTYFSPLLFSAIKLGMNVSSMPASLALLKLTTQISILKEVDKKKINKISFWLILSMCLLTVLINQFYLVKIIAGIVILYSISIHLKCSKIGMKGSGLIASGFIFSLSSLFVHTTQFSISEWFNYKDISHVIMNTSLIIIFIGVNTSANFFQLTENQRSKT